MEKKFIKPNWKALRKLDSNLREAFFYCWDKADNIGVYDYDQDYMQIDLGFCLPFNDLLNLPGAVKIGHEKLLFEDFIIINYVQLKPNYNPHKPAYRDLEKNSLILNSSLTQACLKLVEEEEGKEEGKEEGFGKSENLLNENLIIPQMWATWKASFPKYTSDKETDFPALGDILRFMLRQSGTNEITETGSQIKILNTFQFIADQVNREPFWANKPLKSIASNIQEFYNKIKNPINGKSEPTKYDADSLKRKVAERYGGRQ